MLYQMIIFPSAINHVLAVIVKKGNDVQVSVTAKKVVVQRHFQLVDFFKNKILRSYFLVVFHISS